MHSACIGRLGGAQASARASALLSAPPRRSSPSPALPSLSSRLSSGLPLCALRHVDDSAERRSQQGVTVMASVDVAAVEEKTAKIIDGKAIAKQIHGEVAEGVAELKEATGKVPGLAVIIVGERKDSQTYVRMKVKACEEVGIASFEKKLPGTATQEEVVAAVKECNGNPEVHGVLVQLPLPAHINEEAVLAEVALEKDVDGFHPINIGQLAMKGRHPLFAPCTPEGCIVLLERSGITIAGKQAVVIGRSNIVGMPAAMLLMERDATVTVVHSRSPDPQAIVRQADVVIAAVGRAEMVKADWLKPGAAVIDVGINAVDDPSKKAGYRLVGDVDFAGASKVAGWITPVPGGVGPMTIAVLLQHTLTGAQRALKSD